MIAERTEETGIKEGMILPELPMYNLIPAVVGAALVNVVMRALRRLDLPCGPSSGKLGCNSLFRKTG